VARWRLGIDFGTNYTVVAVEEGGQVRTVDLEADGKTRMPSAVLLNVDGSILVGTAAERQAVFLPERYEPTPKRILMEQEAFLGDRSIPVTDLVAAVFRRAFTETCRQQGETIPETTVVTHPADWSDFRLERLKEALSKAGIVDAELLPEPVAAAIAVCSRDTSAGTTIAMYDFGGGTFDAAVLSRTSDGFDLAGPPSGVDPLGGEDLDECIVNYLGELLAEEEPDDWARLSNPPDVEWRRNAAEFRIQVRNVKETLSNTGVARLWVPGLNREVQLTKAELNELIRPYVDSTVTCLERAIDAAGTTAGALGGIHLVGGSSRIPLVAETVWRRLDVQPLTHDNPKAVVAVGAVMASMTPVETIEHSLPVVNDARLAPTSEAIAAPDGHPDMVQSDIPPVAPEPSETVAVLALTKDDPDVDRPSATTADDTAIEQTSPVAPEPVGSSPPISSAVRRRGRRVLLAGCGIVLLLAAGGIALAVTSSSAPRPPPHASPQGFVWSRTRTADQASSGITQVSCPTDAFCMVVDNNGRDATYEDSSWSQAESIDGTNELVGLSCASTAFCVATDNNGNALTYDIDGWSKPISIDGTNSINGVSCASATFCMAVADQGDAISYHDGTWSSPEDIDSQQELNAVSCASATFCMAVDNQGGAVSYHDGTWSKPVVNDPYSLTGVSCPTATFCMAVDTQGDAMTYENGTWSQEPVIDSGTDGTNQIDGVSCPSTGFCLAADGSGNILVYAKGAWSDPYNIDSNILVGLSCPTTAFCVVVDSDDNYLTGRRS
jgi:actin-like ATPase involved in cell morphogenesis